MTARPADSARPLRVAVLVDLVRGPQAGGHVRVWERIAEAAVDAGEALDLTVYFSGDTEAEERLSERVRFVTQRPVLSTASLSFLSHVPAHTDLAPYHRRLAARLEDHDVLHTTDAFFAFARTAAKVAQRRRLPLMNSVHTDTPRYTRVFTALTLERLLGGARLAGLFTDGLALPRRAEARMRRLLDEHQRRCAFAWVSRPEERVRLSAQLGPERVGLLRRGLDHRRWTPGARDRLALEEALGLPPGRLLVMYAGRLDRTKNVLVLAEAVRALGEEGWPVHLLCPGEGHDRDAVQAILGERVTLPGMLAPEQLARAYASADLFAQPSILEETSNVVQEALASGLPVVAAAAPGGGARLFPRGEVGLVIDEPEDAAAWTAALRELCRDPLRRQRMGQLARVFAEQAIPSWRDVLLQDLLPGWSRAARPDPRAGALDPPHGGD
jgi:glycosyltransferase involved in cell wall biosynthesis